MARVSAMRSPVAVSAVATFFLVLLALTWWAGQARGQEGGPTALENGQAVAVSFTEAGTREFYLDLPSGRDNLTVSLDGSGMDLFLGLGQAPSTADTACPEIGGVDQCAVDNPPAGRWYILVKAGEADQGSLAAAYTPEGSETAQELSPGQETPVMGGGVYYLDVPGGQGSLLISLVQQGSLNLYSRYGATPDPGGAGYDCLAPAGQAQECLHQSPSPGDGGLTNNRWVTLSNLTPCGEGEMFTINVPEGVALFKVDLITYQSDVALFVRQGAAPEVDDADLCSEDGGIEANKKPDNPPGQDKDKDKGDQGQGNDNGEDDGPARITGTWDCLSYDRKNTEKCSFHWPQGGTWYILVKAYGPSSSVKFKPLYSSNPADEDL